MRVGLGTGSTAHWFIVRPGRRCDPGSASRRSRPPRRVLTSPRSSASSWWSSTGRGSISRRRRRPDRPAVRLIKGGGGAEVRERLVAVAARRFVVVADAGKMVANSGDRSPSRSSSSDRNASLAALEACGAPSACERTLREAQVSDLGQPAGDGHFDLISDPAGLAAGWTRCRWSATASSWAWPISCWWAMRRAGFGRWPRAAADSRSAYCRVSARSD